jgi:NAD(P)-dependent dehydrogenase (short-subunit alcohol dehydrogenase family)
MRVGPGLGRALAVRFARGGFRVALVPRHDESVRATQTELEGIGGSAGAFLDVADEESVRSTLRRIHDECGAPEVLLYNAGAFQLGGIPAPGVGTR